MTQQIQPTSNLSIPFTSQSFTSSTTSTSNQASSSSSRSGMRRLRTETTTPPRFTTTSASTSTSSTTQRIYEEFQERFLQLKKAFEKEKYDKALRLIDELEPLIRESLDELICKSNSTDSTEIDPQKLKKVRDLVGDAIMAGSRAYFLAYLDDPRAISLCDIGFEKINKAVHILHDGDESRNSFQEIVEFIKNGHRFYRGLLELGLGKREEAMQDLQRVFRDRPDFLEQIGFWNGRSLHLFFRALEEKLDTHLMPPCSEDASSTCSLNTTEKAIQLFAEGNFEEAKKVIFEYPDLLIYFMLPLVIRGFETK
jgi:tetratricopeptide (TPR) repeat protein